MLPSEVELASPAGWVHQGSVRLGAVRAKTIVAMYEKYGDSLFFENIRDFLGVTSGKKEVDDRETVNGQIINTLRMDAVRMLEKNNGITFRAASVSGDEAGVKIRLDGAAIVNGCQTTMCLWHCRSAIHDKCFVAVKVVETEDGWSVAKSAFYQNPVAQIDLDLAKYLRPQLVQKAATDAGYGLRQESEATITGVLDAIHQKLVDYDEMKCLYLGLFSRKPNNVFSDNYTELRDDVLEGLCGGEGGYEKEVFETVFLLVSQSQRAIEVCQQTFSDPSYDHFFKRFHDPEKPKYRAYISTLAVCGALKDDIMERSLDTAVETERMKQFLLKTRELIENTPERFEDCYIHAYKIVAAKALDAWKQDRESLVTQEMHQRVSRTNFSALYTELRMALDVEARQRRKNTT